MLIHRNKYYIKLTKSRLFHLMFLDLDRPGVTELRSKTTAEVATAWEDLGEESGDEVFQSPRQSRVVC